MVVVRHQHTRVEAPTIRFDGALQPVKTLLSIVVVTNDVRPLISMGHHVIQRAGKFDTEGLDMPPRYRNLAHLQGLMTNDALTPLAVNRGRTVH